MFARCPSFARRCLHAPNIHACLVEWAPRMLTAVTHVASTRCLCRWFRDELSDPQLATACASAQIDSSYNNHHNTLQPLSLRLISSSGTFPNDNSVPISFIYGVRSMMDYSIGERTKRLRPASHVEWHVLNDCGHHVYCENHYEFNSLVLQTAEYLEHPDSGLDSGSEAVDMSDVADAVVPDGVDGEDGPDCDAVAACEESVRRECVGGLFDHLGVDSAAAAQCVSTSPLGRAASSQYDEVDA
eukprot:m.25689 g.25689  ORF g.25689 m.25689 type:complete len:243 (+) comp4199_c0_seq1:934-1662(+)